jgi:Histidine kinase
MALSVIRLDAQFWSLSGHSGLSKESAHRVLNGLQLITSLLSMQSRATKNAEAATQLTSAAIECTLGVPFFTRSIRRDSGHGTLERWFG